MRKCDICGGMYEVVYILKDADNSELITSCETCLDCFDPNETKIINVVEETTK